MNKIIPGFLSVLLFVSVKIVVSQPIVIKGEMIRELCNAPISSLRLCTSEKMPIPFQVDELTETGNYICDKGDEPNADSSNGILDPKDEIVFLQEDCQPYDSSAGTMVNSGGGVYYPLIIRSQQKSSVIYITRDTSVTLSAKRYIAYDHEKQYVKTPYYYAQFGKNRFHFTNAGVWDPSENQFIHITNELAIAIHLKALWGLIPINYTENNLVCIVKQYKCGPVRLIRGGNFHLNLGLGLKGSHAYVNQLCYSQIVKVPVNVHVPVRFRAFFSEAYIEMCPVIKRREGFKFQVPAIHFTDTICSKKNTDSLVYVNPNNEFYAVTDGEIGYGWILEAKIENPFLKGSCFLIRKPSYRDKTCVEYGYRMMVRDLPKGRYEINNWVSFSTGTYSSLISLSSFIKVPASIETPWGLGYNFISANPLQSFQSEKKR